MAVASLTRLDQPVILKVFEDFLCWVAGPTPRFQQAADQTKEADSEPFEWPGHSDRLCSLPAPEGSILRVTDIAGAPRLVACETVDDEHPKGPGVKGGSSIETFNTLSSTQLWRSVWTAEDVAADKGSTAAG